MKSINDLNVKIFGDGADLGIIKQLYEKPFIKGFTTNPTLMKAAGITDYKAFALEVLAAVPDRPVSFEVFADEFDDMIDQGFEIGSWGANVNVKIPVFNSLGEFTGDVVRHLSGAGIHVNVTAMFTLDQVNSIVELLDDETPAYVSIFAGRIADSGLDPVPLMADAVKILKKKPLAELIWASPREVYNIFHAEQVGCHIITVTPGILQKLPLVGKDQTEYSLETARMFQGDAAKAGFEIPVAGRKRVTA